MRVSGGGGGGDWLLGGIPPPEFITSIVFIPTHMTCSVSTPKGNQPTYLLVYRGSCIQSQAN